MELVWKLLIMIGVPVALSATFAALIHRRVELDVFQCLRCERSFQRRVGRPFAAACPHCRARDWNVLGTSAGR